jgi:hypothetical protein
MTELTRIGDSLVRWRDGLKAIASKPLVFCPDFPALARRWEAWWAFESPRPLLIASVAGRSDIRHDKAFDLLEQPDAWLAVRRTQMEATCFAADTPPSIRVDLGPVATAAYLGAPLLFAAKENTSWQTPIIEEWSDTAVPDLDPRNRWLQATLALMAATARDASGRYLVCLPDLSGAFDILANLRGTERLLMDLHDQPDAVRRGVDRAVDAWEQVFASSYETILGEGAGVTSWVQPWSDRPYTVPTCDFNFMIGPEMFREQVMPSLAEQARRAGRSLFHLDGPGAARHAVALAEEPAITAVQFTPGAGTPSALAWLDMFCMLQEARKPLAVFCPCEEVRELAARLDPRGLALMPEGIRSPEHLQELQRELGQ